LAIGEPAGYRSLTGNAQEGMLGYMVAAHAAQLFGGGFARVARAPTAVAAALPAAPQLISYASSFSVSGSDISGVTYSATVKRMTVCPGDIEKVEIQEARTS
jgi:hypothetical protein